MTRDRYTTPEPAEAPQPAGPGAVSGWKVIREITCGCSQKSIGLPDNCVVVTRTFSETGWQFLARAGHTFRGTPKWADLGHPDYGIPSRSN
jgi:hypothetical protein